MLACGGEKAVSMARTSAVSPLPGIVYVPPALSLATRAEVRYVRSNPADLDWIVT
jgi:hypothetical protein